MSTKKVTQRRPAGSCKSKGKGPRQTAGACVGGISIKATTPSSKKAASGSSSHRRVTIIGGEGGSADNSGSAAGGMKTEERRGSSTSFGSSSHPLQMEHGGVGDIFGRRPNGFDPSDFLGGSSSRRESHLLSPLGSFKSAASIDAAILDLTRRRLSVAMSSGESGMDNSGHSAHSSANKWAGAAALDAPEGPTGMPSYGHSPVAALSARQRQLQQQQKELEYRQIELEMQRQQLLAHMHDHHANQSNFFAHGQQAPPVPPCNKNDDSNGQQQWWVCQVCNSKAFASHDDAMQHEVQCCPEPHKFESMAGSMHIPDFGSYAPFHFALSPSARSTSPFSDNGLDALDCPITTLGAFSILEEPIPLAMESDKDWLTPLHCFVRRQCVEVFTASEKDVSTPSKGKRKPIQVGQVGIRCPHCHKDDVDSKSRERGSVYYPTSIASIYNATMNLLQRHLSNCTSVPEEIMHQYDTLKSDDARSGTSKKYWIESSLSLGLVDTPTGIRFSSLEPPPLPILSTEQHSTGAAGIKRRNSNDFFSSNSNAVADLKSHGGPATMPSLDPPEEAEDARMAKDKASGEPPEANKTATERSLAETAQLVLPEDEACSTTFSFQLIGQMQPCVFTEADRLGKRKGLPAGFPGLACRHCFGGYGSGRFFPSSIKTLSDTSKTLNVLHNHMMRCRKCPEEVRTSLEKLRKTHDEERGKMKFGSQKAFFARVWTRLHGEDGDSGIIETPRKRKATSPPGQCPPEQYAESEQFFEGGPPPLTQSLSGSMLDPQYFGPPIMGPIGAGMLSHNNSFTALDALDRSFEMPETKRQKI